MAAGDDHLSTPRGREGFVLFFFLPFYFSREYWLSCCTETCHTDAGSCPLFFWYTHRSLSVSRKLPTWLIYCGNMTTNSLVCLFSCCPSFLLSFYTRSSPVEEMPTSMYMISPPHCKDTAECVNATWNKPDALQMKGFCIDREMISSHRNRKQ